MQSRTPIDGVARADRRPGWGRRGLLLRAGAFGLGSVVALALGEIAATTVQRAADRFRRGEDHAVLHPVADEIGRAHV